MKKVLITGATGLIGSEIVAELRSQDIEVHYLSTSRDKIKATAGYTGFYWNPAKGEIDDACFNGVTHIINLAGATIAKRWTEAYKKEVLNSRVDSLRTLHTAIKALKGHTIKSFVAASAIGLYPNSLSTLYTENYSGEADDSFLGDVVAAWEREIDSFKQFSFSVARIRIGLVLSTNGGALPEMAKPMKLYAGAAFGSGEQWQSWIHIKDLARMFIYVADKALEGIYNGVGPNPVTNTKLTTELAKVLDKPLLLPNVPEFAMKMVLGEMAYLLFTSQRVSSRKIEKMGFHFTYINICKALEALYAKETVKTSSAATKEYA